MTAPDNGPVVADRAISPSQKLRPIDIAFADYDRTRPLIDGRVKAKGLELRATNKWVGDFCTRPVYEDFDAAEMSLSWYVAARDRGEPCIAIPIFPLRDPILAFVYTRTDSPITKPVELIGKRIGLEGFRFTISLVLRGVFKDYYGLSPEQVTWVTSEAELNDYVPPANIRIELRQGKSAPQKLKDGEVDAIFCPRVPSEFQNGEPWLRRLFPDCQAEFQRLVKKLGYIPVSHTIVMKKELAAREPWIAISLYDAFVEGQKQADEFCWTEKMISYVDSMFIIEQQKAAYGDDPFRHGFAPNRKAMEDFIRYAHEQNYISRRMTPEELFVPETLGL